MRESDSERQSFTTIPITIPMHKEHSNQQLIHSTKQIKYFVSHLHNVIQHALDLHYDRVSSKQGDSDSPGSSDMIIIWLVFLALSKALR
jgi:hypothetical protein